MKSTLSFLLILCYLAGFSQLSYIEYSRKDGREIYRSDFTIDSNVFKVHDSIIIENLSRKDIKSICYRERSFLFFSYKSINKNRLEKFTEINSSVNDTILSIHQVIELLRPKENATFFSKHPKKPPPTKYIGLSKNQSIVWTYNWSWDYGREGDLQYLIDLFWLGQSGEADLKKAKFFPSEKWMNRLVIDVKEAIYSLRQ